MGGSVDMAGAPREERNGRSPGQENGAGSAPQHKRQGTGRVGRQRWSLHLGTAEAWGAVVALAAGVNTSHVDSVWPEACCVCTGSPRAGQFLSQTLNVPLVVKKVRMGDKNTQK